MPFSLIISFDSISGPEPHSSISFQLSEKRGKKIATLKNKKRKNQQIIT